jgi:SAM-dependent methyltransferase
MTDERGRKQAAVDIWTKTPSGDVGGDPKALRAADVEQRVRHETHYAPWLSEALEIDLAEGRRVLDVGCGPGTLLVRLARAGADVVGIDLVPSHIELARQSLHLLGLRADLEVADAEELPFSDASFDRVVANNSLQFTPDLDAALREIHRVLRPGGTVHVVLYHRRSMYFWWRFVLLRGVIHGDLARLRSMERVVAENIPWGRPGSALVARALTRRRLRRALTRAGLVHLRTSVHGFSWTHLAPFGPMLAHRAGDARLRRIDRALDRAAGWYLVGVGRRPA